MPTAPLFAVYASSRGNYFFMEIRRLLADGLRSCGVRVIEADERRGFSPRADWHLVVAPQEFFTLGRGARLQRGSWPDGVILYHSEQPGYRTAPLVAALAPRASAVWAMDAAEARRLRARGARARHVPLGFVPGSALFAAGKARRRNLDALFIGSAVPRRRAFFARAGLERRAAVVRLVDDDAFVLPGRRPWDRSREALELARSARLVLNIHRRPSRFFEWHRVAVHGLGQGALVLSEPVAGCAPLRPGRDFLAAPLRDFPRLIRELLDTSAGRRRAARVAASGRSSYMRLCRMDRYLAPALAALGRPDRPEAVRRRAAAGVAAGLAPLHWRTGRLEVLYLEGMDGGGPALAAPLERLLALIRPGRVPRALEWCAGAGFIGFHLLAAGKVGALTLADRDERAMTCARLTARRGGLARRVALRPGHNLDGLRAGDRFDLVIGNPPELDPGRALRAGFWSRVGRHLRPGGLVVVCEVQPGPGALAAAARASGLEAVGSFPIALTTRGKRLEALVARRPS